MRTGRPKLEKPMKQKSIRFDIDRWQLALAKARKNKVKLHAVIRQLLDAWIDGKIVIDVKNVD